MKTDLKDYVKLYKSVVPADVCDQTVKEMDNIEFQEHQFYNANTGQSAPRSGSKELEMSWGNVSTKPALNNLINEMAQIYLRDISMPWFNRYQRWSHVRFNKYAETKQMALHCDHIHSMFDGERKGIPILSVLGVLNDDYEGGEFIVFDDYVVPFKKGDICVFPSVFLFPHKVEPVTKGTRYSYISWVW